MGRTCRRPLFGSLVAREIATLAGEKLENEKIRGMETRHGDVHQVFVSVGNVFSNQDAQFLHRYTQLLSRFHFGVLSLILLGG
jgi:hypothetical protein